MHAGVRAANRPSASPSHTPSLSPACSLVSPGRRLSTLTLCAGDVTRWCHKHGRHSHYLDTPASLRLLESPSRHHLSLRPQARYGSSRHLARHAAPSPLLPPETRDALTSLSSALTHVYMGLLSLAMLSPSHVICTDTFPSELWWSHNSPPAGGTVRHR